MLFFRSEEHVDRWYTGRSIERGESFSLQQLWELARLWYSNRLDLDYSGRSYERIQVIFSRVNLVSEFWKA